MVVMTNCIECARYADPFMGGRERRALGNLNMYQKNERTFWGRFAPSCIRYEMLGIGLRHEWEGAAHTDYLLVHRGCFNLAT